MNNIAVYPGSFDPITNGHLDIIERSSRVFDKLIVAVLENPDKKSYMFDAPERVELIKKVVKNIENVEVESFKGLLVNYAESKNASVIVRGLRAMSDFEYEFQMTLMNQKLKPSIETFFMMTKNEYSYLSSSAIKQVAHYGGDIDKLVPNIILNDILEKVKNKK